MNRAACFFENACSKVTNATPLFVTKVTPLFRYNQIALFMIE